MNKKNNDGACPCRAKRIFLDSVDGKKNRNKRKSKKRSLKHKKSRKSRLRK